MKLPVVHGVIERRILVNYRVDPAILAAQLPSPFRPKLVSGFGVAGICLIRLREIRPQFIPSLLGHGSENAAHRIAVAWDEEGLEKTGVFVHRRDTDSRLNTWVGGRLFPGVHHHAKFTVDETDGRFSVEMKSDDEKTWMSVSGRISEALPADSVFKSVPDASAFFAAGSLGYSPSRKPYRFEGLELKCDNWRVEPLAVDHVASSYFEDTRIFPAGSVNYDCALLMRGIRHEWHSREVLY